MWRDEAYLLDMLLAAREMLDDVSAARRADRNVCLTICTRRSLGARAVAHPRRGRSVLALSYSPPRQI